jgi:hypothetical protein
MPSTFVPNKFALLTGNGTADGLATIASNVGWLPGATVWIRDNDTPSLECVIVEQVGSTQVRLREKASTAKHGGGADLTAYTTLQAASLNMEAQVVPVDAPFEPRPRA